jgi:hypothetical protein
MGCGLYPTTASLSQIGRGKLDIRVSGILARKRKLPLDEILAASGVIDFLAKVQIVMYLENTCGIDFAARGGDPERRGSMS